MSAENRTPEKWSGRFADIWERGAALAQRADWEREQIERAAHDFPPAEKGGDQ